MTHRRTTHGMFHRARELRHELTPAEAKLWARLRTLREAGIHFRSQHAIGPYITDFCAPRRKPIIEVEGSQHLDQQEYDAERTHSLEQRKLPGPALLERCCDEQDKGRHRPGLGCIGKVELRYRFSLSAQSLWRCFAVNPLSLFPVGDLRRERGARKSRSGSLPSFVKDDTYGQDQVDNQA